MTMEIKSEKDEGYEHPLYPEKKNYLTLNFHALQIAEIKITTFETIVANSSSIFVRFIIQYHTTLQEMSSEDRFTSKYETCTLKISHTRKLLKFYLK